MGDQPNPNCRVWEQKVVLSPMFKEITYSYLTKKMGAIPGTLVARRNIIWYYLREMLQTSSAKKGKKHSIMATSS